MTSPMFSSENGEPMIGADGPLLQEDGSECCDCPSNLTACELVDAVQADVNAGGDGLIDEVVGSSASGSCDFGPLTDFACEDLPTGFGANCFDPPIVTNTGVDCGPDFFPCSSILPFFDIFFGGDAARIRWLDFSDALICLRPDSPPLLPGSPESRLRWDIILFEDTGTTCRITYQIGPSFSCVGWSNGWSVRWALGGIELDDPGPYQLQLSTTSHHNTGFFADIVPCQPLNDFQEFVTVNIF